MKKEPKVFVVMDSGKNLSPAREHGELHVMLTGKESIELATSKLEHRLRLMEPGDFLLLIGNPLFIGLATAIAFEFLGAVNFLIWDRESYTYKKQKAEYGTTNQSTNASASL